MLSNLRSNQSGFTIIEVLVAVTVLVIGIVSTVTVANVTLQASDTNRDKVAAANLAREGIELVRNIRDSNWAEYSNQSKLNQKDPATYQPPNPGNWDCYPNVAQAATSPRWPGNASCASHMSTLAGPTTFTVNQLAGASGLAAASPYLTQTSGPWPAVGLPDNAYRIAPCSNAGGPILYTPPGGTCGSQSFYRKVTISQGKRQPDNTTYSIKVVSTVTWDERAAKGQPPIEVEEYLTDWRIFTATCSDTVDNDGDGKIDHPADPGCISAADTDESDAPPPSPPPPPAVCADGADNDGDSKVDFPADPGCTSTADGNETDPPPPPPPPAVCGDGADNDGDGKVDYPADPGCTSSADSDETDPAPPPPPPPTPPPPPPTPPAICADGADNDGDGKVDYPADPGCTAVSDADETDPVPPPDPAAQARDRQRIADIEQILSMLRQQNLIYGCCQTTNSYGGADVGGWDYSSYSNSGSSHGSNWLLPGASEWANSGNFPVDPINNGSGDVMFPSLGGSGYAYAFYCYSSAEGWPSSVNGSITLGAVLERPQDYAIANPYLVSDGGYYCNASSGPPTTSGGFTEILDTIINFFDGLFGGTTSSAPGSSMLAVREGPAGSSQTDVPGTTHLWRVGV